ncbi:MAG TPA: cbb3-type cytochrome c oxidase subunit 3 [Gammaproteobacteria bacterium]|nr:cbb3-type cytochrome c oxidase subunit 3 [Gammaproteobacteria bacterium]
MNFTLLQSLWSIVVLVTFIGIVLWAYSSKRKSAFDEAAQLPFDDEPPGDSNDPSPPKKPARSR